MKKSDFNFYQNTDCRYFPCHGKEPGTGSVPVEDFNCLFCYCPLMHVPNCGGNYTIMENGFKDCMKCTRNHDKDSWKFVISRLRDIMEVKVKFSRIDAIGQNGNDGDHYEK